MFWNNKKSGKYNSGWWLVLTRVKSDIIRGVYTPLFLWIKFKNYNNYYKSISDV